MPLDNFQFKLLKLIMIISFKNTKEPDYQTFVITSFIKSQNLKETTTKESIHECQWVQFSCFFHLVMLLLLCFTQYKA